MQEKERGRQGRAARTIQQWPLEARGKQVMRQGAGLKPGLYKARMRGGSKNKRPVISIIWLVMIGDFQSKGNFSSVPQHPQNLPAWSDDKFRAGDSGSLSVVKGNKRLTRLFPGE